MNECLGSSVRDSQQAAPNKRMQRSAHSALLHSHPLMLSLAVIKTSALDEKTGIHI
jgi:hypothetical protein